MRDDRDHLDDILQHIGRIQTYTKDGKQVFMNSEIIQDAVIRNFVVIGEAARNLSEELRANHPEVPWRQIAAFRNFVIHAYWGVKMERVWQIIKDELLPLKIQIEAILQTLDEEDYYGKEDD